MFVIFLWTGLTSRLWYSDGFFLWGRKVLHKILFRGTAWLLHHSFHLYFLSSLPPKNMKTTDRFTCYKEWKTTSKKNAVFWCMRPSSLVRIYLYTGRPTLSYVHGDIKYLWTVDKILPVCTNSHRREIIISESFNVTTSTKRDTIQTEPFGDWNT